MRLKFDEKLARSNSIIYQFCTSNVVTNVLPGFICKPLLPNLQIEWKYACLQTSKETFYVGKKRCKRNNVLEFPPRKMPVGIFHQ